MKVNRILEAGILAMLCAFVGVLYLSLHDNVVKAGDRAPDFSIQADNGKTITARDFGGKLSASELLGDMVPSPVSVRCRRSINCSAPWTRKAVVILGVSEDEDPQAYQQFSRPLSRRLPHRPATDQGHPIEVRHDPDPRDLFD